MLHASRSRVIMKTMSKQKPILNACSRLLILVLFFIRSFMFKIRTWVCWAKIMSNVNICPGKGKKRMFAWKLPANFSIELMRIQSKWIEVHFPKSRKFDEFSVRRDNTSFVHGQRFHLMRNCRWIWPDSMRKNLISTWFWYKTFGCWGYCVSLCYRFAGLEENWGTKLSFYFLFNLKLNTNIFVSFDTRYSISRPIEFRFTDKYFSHYRVRKIIRLRFVHLSSKWMIWADIRYRV